MSLSNYLQHNLAYEIVSNMNTEAFAKFSEAYRAGLREAVAAKPDDYGVLPTDDVNTYADRVSTKMLAAIADKPMGVNYDGGGFRRACKAIGIKHTRKAIFEYLGTK